MTSTFGAIAKTAGVTTALTGGFAAADISNRPTDARTVSKSVVDVVTQTGTDIWGTAFDAGFIEAKKSGMSFSKALKSSFRDSVNKPIQILKDKMAKEVAEKTGKKVAEKAGKKVAQKAGEKVATQLGKTAGTQVASKAAATGTLLGMGPVGWALLIIQMSFMVLDLLWNPFQTYFNKDLSEIKESIDASIRKEFLKNGADYPLEIKPEILPSTDEEHDEFSKYVKQYYDDNGLIFSEDVIKEESLYQDLNLLTRRMDIALNPLYQNIGLLSGTNQNAALLIATAVAKKKGYRYLPDLKRSIDMDYDYQPDSNKIDDWVKLNWQLLVICVIFTSISISISLGVLYY
jgi:hypothetical protein